MTHHPSEIIPDNELGELVEQPERFVALLRTAIDEGKHQRAYQLLGFALQIFGDTGPSSATMISLYDLYLKRWKRSRNEITAEILLLAAHAASNARDFKQSEHYLLRAISLSSKKWPELLRRSLQSLGVLRHHQERFGDRDDLYEQALEIAKREDDSYGIAQLYNNLGASCLDSNPKKAVRYLQKSIKLKRRFGSAIDVARTQIALAGGFGRLGNLDQALLEIEQALRIVRREKDIPLLAMAHHNKGITLDDAGKPARAIVELKKGLRYSQESEDLSLVRMSLQSLAVVSHRAGKAASAAQYFMSLRPVCEQLEDRFGAAMASHDCGSANVEMKKTATALALYSDAAKRFKQVGDELWSARCTLNIAKLTAGTDRKAAVRELLKMIKPLPVKAFPISEVTDLALSTNDDSLVDEAIQTEGSKRRQVQSGWGFRLSVLGATQLHRRRWLSAKALLVEAVRVHRAAKDSESTGAAANDAGISLLEIGDFTAARKSFSNALAIARREENRVLAANSSHNLGEWHLRRGNVAMSLKFFNESLALAKAVNDIESIAGTLHSIGLSELARNQIAAAEHAFRESEKLAKRLNDDEHFGQAVMGLGSVAYRREDYRLAERQFAEAAKTFKAVGVTHKYVNALYERGLAIGKSGKHQRAFNVMAKAAGIATDEKDFSMLAIILQGMSYLVADHGTEKQTAKLLGHAIMTSLASHDQTDFRRVVESYRDALLKLDRRMKIKPARFAESVMKGVSFSDKSLIVIIKKRLLEANASVVLTNRTQ